jgi:hypothetical protein
MDNVMVTLKARLTRNTWKMHLTVFHSYSHSKLKQGVAILV